ncbi:MAG: polyhydroxyalkanoate synthesis repressor PhaR [Rhodospirillaceae bacterium]
MADRSADAKVITIKKYANRRLYNTKTSSYVTLDHLAEMIKKNGNFVVIDAKTGEDLTCPVLTQIIVEQEGKGQNLLPNNFLRQIIRFYGDSLGEVLPRYLEQSMEVFSQNECLMRETMQAALKEFPQIEQLEDFVQKNFSAFEKSMKLAGPFSGQTTKQQERRQDEKTATSQGSQTTGSNVDSLKAQLDAMQFQLESLLRNKGI